MLSFTTASAYPDGTASLSDITCESYIQSLKAKKNVNQVS